ncbi:MAG TPA: ABC transporter substrate-binding protein [Acidimicrobiales bacterium]|nr:ABC transporter substrate-binding protein [Acidimicrobiales bacterium]
MSKARPVVKAWRAGALLAAVSLGAAACGGSSSPTSASTTTTGAGLQHIGGSVSLWAEWTGTEQQDFQSVLQPFESKTGITVNYAGKGSNMDTALEAAVQGGAPPDVALVPDPGTLRTLAQQGSIKDLGPVIGNLSSDFGSAWNQLATVNGKLYGVWFKGANKDTVWYNPAEFAAAGIKSPPKTWEELLSDASTLKAAGIPPVSLCTDVGWPVADLWQNVYLKTAGATAYNNLSDHTTKWTDPTVTTAFNTLAKLVGQPSYLLGGTQGALASTYPECADKVFPKPGASPAAAMVFEADFVVSEIVGNSTNYTAGTTGSGGATCTADPSKTPCYDFFAFPPPAADTSNASSIQAAGDVAMLMHTTPQAEALIKYLASPDSGAIWAHIGGFASPNKAVAASSYPDTVSRNDAAELQNAGSLVFSLDDLQGSWEKSMWQDMLNFVKDPSPANVATVEKTMDSQATASIGH